MSNQNHHNPFENFFQSSTYLAYKNHLYNYSLRKEVIQKALHSRSDTQTLEVGSGISLISDLTRDTLYSDVTIEAMQFLKQNGVTDTVMVSSLMELPLKDSSFANVICSEVLEHIPDDEKALSEIARVLKPGGSLLMTVPMHQYFFHYDDRFVGHFRRYNPDAITRSLESKGLEVIECRKVTALLEKAAMLFAVGAYSLVRKLGSSSKKRNEGKSSGLLKALLPVYVILNRLYYYLVRFEAWLMPRSLTTVMFFHCRKKSPASL